MSAASPAVSPKPAAPLRRRAARLLKTLAAGVLAAAMLAYLGLAGVLYAQQRQILFRPDPTRVDPAAVGFARAREVALNAPGAPRLIGWHVPPADAARPVLLYLHGNAANIGRRASRFAELTRGGDGLLALSWRGYGGSEGTPSERGFHEDVAQALAFLKREGIGSDRIVLFGESLGTGMAVMTAARMAAAGAPPRALILDSPYESIAAIAADRYWWMPVRLLISDPFRADLAAPKVTTPTFAIHCVDDWITPYAGAKRLLALLGGPKEFVTVESRCHVPSLRGRGSEALAAFLARIERKNG